MGGGVILFFVIRHECGGFAHLVGGSLVVGWNLYCCSCCGEAYFKRITVEMLDRESLEECC
jgi:hypothetical protein